MNEYVNIELDGQQGSISANKWGVEISLTKVSVEDILDQVPIEKAASVYGLEILNYFDKNEIMEYLCEEI